MPKLLNDSTITFSLKGKFSMNKAKLLGIRNFLRGVCMKTHIFLSHLKITWT